MAQRQNLEVKSWFWVAGTRRISIGKSSFNLSVGRGPEISGISRLKTWVQ
jgi:hypothetical protein